MKMKITRFQLLLEKVELLGSIHWQTQAVKKKSKLVIKFSGQALSKKKQRRGEIPSFSYRKYK